MAVIEVAYRKGVIDPAGQGIRKEIGDLNIPGTEDVRTIRLYYVEGTPTAEEQERICRELLADNVTQSYRFGDAVRVEEPEGAWVVEVRSKPGVTDAAGASTLEGIRVLGIGSVSSVSTGTAYVIDGRLAQDELETVCRRVLANPVIQDYRYWRVGE